MPDISLRSPLRTPRKPLPVLVVLAAAVLANLLCASVAHSLGLGNLQSGLDNGFVGAVTHRPLGVSTQRAVGVVAGGMAGSTSGAAAASSAAESGQDSTAGPVTRPSAASESASIDPPAVLPAETQQLLDDSKRQQAQLVDLRQRLAASEAANRWLPWLLLGLVGALAGLLWSGLRLHRTRREHDQRTWSAAAAELSASLRPDGSASAATPLFSPDQRLGPSPDAAVPLAAPSDGPAGSAPDPHRDVVARAAADTTGGSQARSGGLGLGAFGSGVPPRPVSVEELLDLEQQVDFFMVLGQQQSAIDLLLGHVRATGGTSALPYFKLLEIYRHQQDEAAYERTRERFNLRFNAAAPDWQGDLAAGRQLDAYPEVIERLQHAWASPLRAVAELESLLLRRTDMEPFDLPAFHDVLTLHALVRDMPTDTAVASNTEQAASDAQRLVPATGWADLPPASTVAMPNSSVDLLLPLGDVGMPSTGRQAVAEPVGARAMLAEWVYSRSTVPASNRSGVAGALQGAVSRPAKLDLDLSDFAPAPREFTRPAAFTDVDMRRDSRISDLAPFDDSDLLPPSISRR